MSFSSSTRVPREALDAISQHGSLAKVPGDLLRQLRLVRLHDPEKRGYAVLSSAEYGSLVARCLSAKKRFSGYIFAHHLNRMHGLMDRRNTVTQELLAVVTGRARAFLKAGIPPIFQEEFYNSTTFVYFATEHGSGLSAEVRYESLFPSIDFIIQYGAGSYERHRAAMAAKITKNETRTKIPLQPASVEDVLAFRRWAFTDEGRVEPLLVTETLGHIAEHFTFSCEERKRDVLAEDGLVFSFLEGMLTDLPHEPRAFQEWSGDSAVVYEPRWYLRFRPEAREGIARAYLDGLVGPLRGKDRTAFQRLASLYPYLCADAAEQFNVRSILASQLALERQIVNALQNGNFRDVSERAFSEEPWCSDFVPKFERAFREACRRLGGENPEALFSNAQDLHKHLPVPARIPLVPRFKCLLDDVRLEVAVELTDEQFRQLFGGEAYRRRAGIGHRRSGEYSSPGHMLRAYLSSRAQELGI